MLSRTTHRNLRYHRAQCRSQRTQHARRCHGVRRFAISPAYENEIRRSIAAPKFVVCNRKTSMVRCALVVMTIVGPKIVCVGTMPFAHGAATIGMGGRTRGIKAALHEQDSAGMHGRTGLEPTA
jgi:hypothetical protein